MKLNGVPLDPAATYNVTVNNFLADGGDNFGTFATITARGSMVATTFGLVELPAARSARSLRRPPIGSTSRRSRTIYGGAGASGFGAPEVSQPLESKNGVGRLQHN